MANKYLYLSRCHSKKQEIFSSENGASMRKNQQQTTNGNIKLPDLKKSAIQARDVNVDYTTYRDYPSVSPSINNNAAAEVPKYPSVDQTEEVNELHSQVEDLTNNITDLETKNQFLELLVQVSEDIPIKLNSYLICKS